MRSEDQERAASRWPAASSSVPAPAALMSPGRPVWGRGRGGGGGSRHVPGAGHLNAD